jgi:5-methylcytosine-specific restriction endonuclease McrA
VSRVERTGAIQVTVATSRRVVRGYAASRRRYDARRRRVPLDAESKAYAALVRRDPCSLCMGDCGQKAADHIVPLDSDGENAWTNLTCAGRPCNAAKKDKPLLIFLLERRGVAR